MHILRYKTLDADEAEEKFAQRGKVLNKEGTRPLHLL
jgi:hypothetical protein